MTAWGGGPGDHPDDGQLTFAARRPGRRAPTAELLEGLTPPRRPRWSTGAARC